MTTTRIATMTATGRKYIVQGVEFARAADGSIDKARSKVRCWGEVSSYRGLSTKHQTSKCFLLSAVEIADVSMTAALVEEMFQQHVAVQREAGKFVAFHGRRYSVWASEAEYVDALRRKADFNARLRDLRAMGPVAAINALLGV